MKSSLSRLLCLPLSLIPRLSLLSAQYSHNYDLWPAQMKNTFSHMIDVTMHPVAALCIRHLAIEQKNHARHIYYFIQEDIQWRNNCGSSYTTHTSSYETCMTTVNFSHSVTSSFHGASLDHWSSIEIFSWPSLICLSCSQASVTRHMAPPCWLRIAFRARVLMPLLLISCHGIQLSTMNSQLCVSTSYQCSHTLLINSYTFSTKLSKDLFVSQSSLPKMSSLH